MSTALVLRNPVKITFMKWTEYSLMISTCNQKATEKRFTEPCVLMTWVPDLDLLYPQFAFRPLEWMNMGVLES